MRYKGREKRRSEINYREIRLYSVQAVKPFFCVKNEKKLQEFGKVCENEKTVLLKNNFFKTENKVKKHEKSSI